MIDASDLSRGHRRGEWEDVTETIRLVRVTCRFGGARPYFICPGVLNATACGRAVAKLYGPGRYFVCRHCHRLWYASQSEETVSRSMPARNKIRQRLGGDTGTASPFLPKPKGCGGEPMSACANKPSTPRSARTKRSRFTSHGCWRGQTTARVKGAFEMNETKSTLPAKIVRDHPLQRAAPWRLVALRRAAVRGRGRNIEPGRVARRRARPARTDRGDLVEELAGILCRKCRLRLAEAAAHRLGIEVALSQSRRTAKRAVVHIDTADGSEDAATAADKEDAVGTCRRTRP